MRLKDSYDLEANIELDEHFKSNLFARNEKTYVSPLEKYRKNKK